jgi:hypothetical protein
MVSRSLVPLCIVLLISLLSGCQMFEPKAYFLISNESRESIDLKVSIAEKVIYNDTVRNTDVRPAFIKNSPSISLPKGKYTITASSTRSAVSNKQPINLSGDRWIFITYQNSIDSAHPIKGPEITIAITEKKPVLY